MGESLWYVPIMDKKLIQRERNRLAERGVELTPDQTEELIAHRFRCLSETITITVASKINFVRKINKTSKLFREFATAAARMHDTVNWKR